MIKCSRCRPGEIPKWGVNCIAYAHTPGAIVHFCSSGERIVRSLNELEGDELAEAQRMVGASAAASKANAAAYRELVDEEPKP